MSSLVLDSVASSNIPTERKSQFLRWYERLMGPQAGPVSQAMVYAKEGVSILRQGTESIVGGAIYGFVDAEFGLDVGKTKQYPIDGIVGGLLLAGAFISAGDPSGISTDMRNFGSLSSGIYTYRKIKEWRESKHAAPPVVNGEDPILALSREL